MRLCHAEQENVRLLQKVAQQDAELELLRQQSNVAQTSGELFCWRTSFVLLVFHILSHIYMHVETACCTD